MIHTIQNELLSLTVKSEGAEMTHVKRLTDQTQYIWKGDKTFWGRHAPVLFPIVGKLKDNQYTYHGTTYQMGQHGFARDHEHELLVSTHNQLTFRLLPNDATRKKYPFDFELQIQYTLDANAVEVAYTVFNKGEVPMPFSIGAHPAFSCPIEEGESLTDYEVVFEQKETADIHLLNGGIFSGETEVFLKDQNRIQITDDLFDRDALVFHELKSEYVELRSKKTDRNVRITTTGFPYLGIWAKPGAPFVCLEPWQGLADHADASGDIMEKTGIHVLLPSHVHKASYEMIFN